MKGVSSRLALAVQLAIGSTSGCLAAPGYECTADEQCDREAGSVCELVSGQCVPGNDDDDDDDDADDGVGADACIVSVVAGGRTSCVRRSDGTLWCWGDNDARLVDPLDESDAVSTLTMPHPDTAFLDADLGALGCGLTTADEVVCWGQRAPDFELPSLAGAGAVAVGTDVLCAGNDETGVRCAAESGGSTPIVATPELPSAVEAIGIGNLHACALRDGAVTCWGDQTDGRLGNGVETGGTAVATVPLPAPATAIAVSLRSTCAVSAGEVSCWGSNENGTVGVSGGARADPTPVELPGPVRSIAAGGKHMCAGLADGTVWCWGDASSGAVDGARGTETLPVEVAGVASLGPLAAGSGHTCTVSGDASVVCWGANDCGQTAPGQPDRDCTEVEPVEPQTTVLSVCDG